MSARQVVATRVWLLLLSGYLSTFSLFFSGTCSWSCSQPRPALPFCCTLSSTFPLKLPCTPLHPWYLAISLQPAKLELDFHLSSEIALYSPPSLVLGHFSAASQAGAGAGLDGREFGGSLEGVWRELELDWTAYDGDILCLCVLRLTTSISASA